LLFDAYRYQIISERECSHYVYPLYSMLSEAVCFVEHIHFN